ncbi:unnamed protein product [Diamesa tonsa]
MEAVETYEHLPDGSRQFNDGLENPSSPPKDVNNKLYLALIMAGIGFVLPYNSFIIASDYWSERFAGRAVELDLSCTYIIVAFATVLLNNVFLSIAPLQTRILFGYVTAFFTLLFVASCEVAWHVFSAETAYSVNLAAVSIIAVGCTVQQSSFYGFSAILPKKYTQALMVGESVAGFLVSSNRVITKLLIKSNTTSTVIYFLLSSMLVALSYVLHSVTKDSPFIKYYMKSCTKIILRPDEMEHADGLDSPPTSEQVQAFSFSNPVYELSNPPAEQTSNESSLIQGGKSNQSRDTSIPSTASYKVEHVLSPSLTSSSRFGSYRRLKAGFEDRLKVAKSIYSYMACIALAYCVTLSLYPGIESEIISCNLNTWMPVLLMFTFNITDVLGKVLAAVPYAWSKRQLILMSTLRTICIPLLLLCVSPRENPTISGEVPAFIFTAALGLTNGVAGSLPIILAPSKIPVYLREICGNMMAVSYNVGLTIGSLIGYIFENMLGPPKYYPCLKYPYIPKPEVIETTTQLTTTFLTTTMLTILNINTTTTPIIPTTTDFITTTLNYVNNGTNT